MIFSSFLGFPRFPTYINKISTIIKINRELKELKKIFNNYSLYEIKNLVGPLFYNIIIDKLVKDGKNGIDGIVDILANYRMSSNLFKENLYDLQTKENQDLYNKINTSIKTSLTKKLNERFKTSKWIKMGTFWMISKMMTWMKKKPMINHRAFLNQLKK